jgi:hypothetical protein
MISPEKTTSSTGVGTGLFALALLAHRGMIQTVEEGLALICEKRPGIGLNQTQIRFIRAYIESISTSTDHSDSQHDAS